MRFTYESMGNSSYLAATFENGESLINYQLQMLVNNNIKNVLSATKKQKNDDIQVFYNITSKIPLEQALGNGKITKNNVLEIINGSLKALKDIEEYQLVSSGLVFEADKIFVKSGEFEPSFVYIPNTTDDNGIQSLKELLLSLIMGSKIEVSNDNFVQVLLETLNKPGFNASMLRKMCEKYQGVKREKFENQRPTPQALSETRQSPQVPAPTVMQNSAIPVAPSEARSPIKPTDNKQALGNKPKSEKIKEDKNSTKEKNPKKPIFTVLQIVFVAIVAGLVLSGVLNDEQGNINIQYLAGVLVAIVCADFIVYREMFVNNKNKSEKKAKETKPAKDVKTKNTKSSVAVPGKENVRVPKSAAKENAKIPVSSNVQTQVKPEMPTVKAQPSVYTPQNTGLYNPVDEFENEDTVIMDENEATVVMNGNELGRAYLEFYENGIAKRLNIDKEQIVVGKLRTQCDFVLNNKKISKVHCEFICRDGQYFVKDFNSTNGTFINGENRRIQSNLEYQIYNGDRITLADVDMTLFC